MDNVDNFRPWDELIPDALALIFKKLSVSEVLTLVPSVCKSWEKAVKGPYCWQEIDIEEWSQNRKPEIVDRMVRMLVARSSGSLWKLCVSGLSSDDSILFIVNNAKSLTTLRLPRCDINDTMVEKVAPILSTITCLDLSYCVNIGAKAIEAIGNHCKHITTFRLTMHPLEVVIKLPQDEEALAIATTMPRLKHLEIAYLGVHTESVIEILKNCKQLELLDVRGCWDVNLEKEFLKKFVGLKVVGPSVVDYYDMHSWDNCSGHSGSSGYLAWDFVAGDMDDDYAEMLDEMLDGLSEDEHPLEDDVEMWFYDDVNVVDASYDWPQSP